MPPATKTGLDKAKAEYASSNAGGTNNNNKSVTINGRVVTDPKQVATINKNREASAMYAAQAYKSQGTPIPGHLKDIVNRQEAERQAASSAKAGAASAATPKAMLGGFTGIRDMFDGGGKGDSGPVDIGGLGAMSNRLGIKPMGAGAIGGNVQPRMAPTPGPNYYAPLGAPGQARESNNPAQSGMSMMAAPMMAPAPEVEAAPAAPQAVDSGNAPTEDGDAVSRANA